MRILFAALLGFSLICSGTAMAQQKQAVTFTGELMAGQSYSQKLPDRMDFSLVPITGGWRVSVAGGGSCGDMASITVPAEKLNVVLPTPADPYSQPVLQSPPPSQIVYALSCNDYKQFIAGNECRAAGKSVCTDMGAVAAGRVMLTINSFVPQRRAYNQPAAYLSIKFTLEVLEPAPSGAN